MAAARPTLSEMRGYGQMWRSSNVTRMNGPTTWLWQLKERGRQAVTEGQQLGAAYFEFSIPDDADPTDEASWWAYHPALADGLLRPDELRADVVELGIENFAAEYLGRWPGALVIRRWSALTEASFMAAGTTTPMPAELPAALGVDMDPFGRSASIAAATHDSGADVVEVIDHRPGGAWLLDAVVALAPSVETIAIADYGGGRDLLAQLAELPSVAGKLQPIGTADFIAACYTTEAGPREGVPGMGGIGLPPAAGGGCQRR